MTIEEVEQLLSGPFPPGVQDDIERLEITFRVTPQDKSCKWKLPDALCWINADSPHTEVHHGDLVQTADTTQKVRGAIHSIVRSFRFDNNVVM